MSHIFTIDSENDIHVSASKEEAGAQADGSEQFGSRGELTRLAQGWPMARLVEIWNGLPGVTAVKRFQDRSKAAGRIWEAIQHLQPARKRVTKTRKQTAQVARTGSRTEQIITLLRQPDGATLEEVMAATGWQSHSVRAFVSAALPNKGLQVESLRRDGQRVYRIAR